MLVESSPLKIRRLNLPDDRGLEFGELVLLLPGGAGERRSGTSEASRKGGGVMVLLVLAINLMRRHYKKYIGDGNQYQVNAHSLLVAS